MYMPIEFVVFCAFVLMIIGNILIYKFIVNRALKKIINPYFNSMGYEVEKAEFPGLFSTGDFKNPGFQIKPVFKNGSPWITYYLELFIKNKDKGSQTIRVTAKIATLFSFIRKVEYSKTLPKLEK
jgi:hypothetical protein